MMRIKTIKTAACVFAALSLAGCENLTERQIKIVKVCCAVLAVGAIAVHENSDRAPRKRIGDPMCSRYPERCR